jgi:hypothetical protein
MTRHRKRNHHHRHKSSPIKTPVPVSQELQSTNPSNTDTKQGFLSYLSASKGFIAASLGYLTTLSQILPASATTLEKCMGMDGLAVRFKDTCYLFYEMGLQKVNEYGPITACNIDPETKWIVDKLAEKLGDNFCGNVSGCISNFNAESFIAELENIEIKCGSTQLPQPDFEECVQNLILNLSKQYEDEAVKNWIIIGYVALAIVGSCALGVGLYYAKKLISSSLEQRQQRAQVSQDATEETRLFSQL